MKKVKILCILIILSGIGLFTYTYFFIPTDGALFQWCIGLGCALIILGLGYLINSLVFVSERLERNTLNSSLNEPYYIAAKQKAGYLVCKCMNIILCIYLLFLNELHVDAIILGSSIALVLIQFLLDLFLQIYLVSRKDK